MNTGVYINDREACSKASDGVSAAAFPDPCWTPPAPPVIVPYPNTSRSSTLSNGTTTVFICNSMVAKEDRSFFSTSTGNEGATQGMPKGLMTGVIKGKSYFQSWSPNVRFEGRCVPRHLDIMGHNQGSFASNTPLFPYVSTGIFDKDECEKERKKIERECAKDEDKSEEKRVFGNKRKRANQDKPPKANNGEWHWTDDHCTGFERTLVKGDGLAESLTENDIDFDKLKEELGTVKDHIADLRDNFDLLGRVEDELKDMAVNAATKAAAKLAAKAALKQAAGSVVPLVGNVAMGLWTLYDVVDTASEIIEITSVAEEAMEQLDIFESEFKKLDDLLGRMEGLKDLPPSEQAKEALKIYYDIQDMQALMNPCLRARKCNLVPYRKGDKAYNQVEHANNGGCCPGQTGHHLVLGAMMTESCKKYDHNVAPVVCVEGFSQHYGSHKRVHDELDILTSETIKKGGLDSAGTMSMEQAIENAAESHQKAFRFSNCSKACIKSQLESYYLDNCKNSRIKPIDKNGNEMGDPNRKPDK